MIEKDHGLSRDGGYAMVFVGSCGVATKSVFTDGVEHQ